MLERWSKLFETNAFIRFKKPPPVDVEPPVKTIPPPVPGAKLEGHFADWDLWRSPTGSWIDVNRENGSKKVRKDGRVAIHDSEGKLLSIARKRHP